jgi:hypothetical protein
VRRCKNALPLPSPSSIASGQQCAVRGRHQAFSPTLKPGKCCTAHSDSTSDSASVSSKSGPCVTLRCPTPGMSVVPLVPLAWCLGAWLALPNPSRWLIRTIRLSYASQSGRFLWAGVPLEQVSRHAVVFTDASATSWGATHNGHAVSGMWTGPQLHWHINCLELLAVILALHRLVGPLNGKHVLICTDHTARWSTFLSLFTTCLPSPPSCHSLRAIHIPGVLYLAADELS